MEEIENALKCLEMDMLDNTQIELLLNYIDKLQKEIKNADERNYNLGLDFIQIGEKLGLENFGTHTILVGIEKLQKENKELKEELQYYKDNIIEDLENRDRWE